MLGEGPGHPPLREDDVMTRGGWHLAYVRVLAFASDGDEGFALVDGNGDGAELYDEFWLWHPDQRAWVFGGGQGSGHIDDLGPCHAGGRTGDAHLAYGSAPGRTTVSVTFDGGSYDVPVSRFGAWAFVERTTDASPELPRRTP